MNFTDPTGMVPEGGGCDDPPCDPDYFDPNEVQELDEVIITAKGGGGKERKHMPAHMKKPLDWWNSDFEGNMNDYNAKHGTDYKDDGTAYGYWQYDNFYEKEYKDQIRSMHEATSTAAELVLYILPMPVAGANGFALLIKRVPNSLKLAGRSLQLRRALIIRNPNALTKRSFGYSDKVTGSAFRQGRGALYDFVTEKPALYLMNSQNFSKGAQWTIGVGTSGAALYTGYKKMLDNNE